MLSLSLKNEIDNLAYPPVFIPRSADVRQFRRRYSSRTRSAATSWNSIVVSGGATLIALLVGVPAGYGIARTGAHRLTVLILIARMTPALSYLIPLFAVFQFLHLNNTLTALGHHPSRHHGADHRLHHGVAFRDAAARTRGGGADRRRQRVDDVPSRGAAAGAPGHRRRRSSCRSSSRGTTSCSARCLRAARRATLPVAVYNVLTFEQLVVGTARGRRDHRHAAGAAADDRDPEGNRRRPDARRRQEADRRMLNGRSSAAVA